MSDLSNIGYALVRVKIDPANPPSQGEVVAFDKAVSGEPRFVFSEGGGGGGGSVDLTAYTGDGGIALRDDSTNGITLQEEATGSFVELIGESVTIYAGGGWTFSFGAFALRPPDEGVANRIYTCATNPNGITIADNVGDLCVTNVGLFLATAPGTDSWAPVSTGSWVSTPNYSFEIITNSPYDGVGTVAAQFPLDPVNHGGGVSTALTVPAFAYPAGGVVTGLSAVIAGLGLNADGIDVEVNLVISDLDGTNTLTVSGGLTIPSQTDSGSFDAGSDLGDPTITGDDLSFSAGAVSSANGGVYGIIATLAIGWD